MIAANCAFFSRHLDNKDFSDVSKDMKHQVSVTLSSCVDPCLMIVAHVYVDRDRCTTF